MQSNLLYQALVSKYDNQKKEALATLSIYFNNPVGIGEHPQHLEEMDKMIDQLAAAEDKLDALTRNFNEDGSVNQPNLRKAAP